VRRCGEQHRGPPFAGTAFGVANFNCLGASLQVSPAAVGVRARSVEFLQLAGRFLMQVLECRMIMDVGFLGFYALKWASTLKNTN